MSWETICSSFNGLQIWCDCYICIWNLLFKKHEYPFVMLGVLGFYWKAKHAKRGVGFGLLDVAAWLRLIDFFSLGNQLHPKINSIHRFHPWLALFTTKIFSSEPTSLALQELALTFNIHQHIFLVCTQNYTLAIYWNKERGGIPFLGTMFPLSISRARFPIQSPSIIHPLKKDAP